MTIHHRTQAENWIFSHGALPWFGFVQQCKLGKKAADELQDTKSRQNTEQMKRAAEVHARVAEYLKKGTTTANKVAEALGLTKTTAYKHCKLLSEEGKAVACMRKNEMHYTEVKR